MGMFDSVIIKYKLPLPNESYGYTGTDQFQTKDLENALDTYELREDGTLWRQDRETEWVEGDKKGKSIIDRFGHLKTIKSWWTKINITQTIKAYSYERTDGEYDYSIDYKIIFIEGTVKSVELEKFEAIPNEWRKQNNKMWMEKLKARKEFENTIRYKFFYGPYNKIVRFIFLKIRQINNFVAINLYKLEDKFEI